MDQSTEKVTPLHSSRRSMEGCGDARSWRLHAERSMGSVGIVVLADTQVQALVDKLIAERKRFKDAGNVDVIHALRRSFDLYMAHHFTPGLPADNNITENVIKQLNKKLRLMEGFESIESAERYVRLLVGCYRFKRFTDSCRKAKNGRSPLELAGADLAGRDWLSFLIDS